jgi:hypothetical protein
LLVLATLYRQGYEVRRYVSLERLFEASHEQYVEALRRSSEGWHEGKHDPIPWLNYFFSILQLAYLEFERRATEPRSNRFNKKIPLVEAAIDCLPCEFTFSELERTCPGASRETISRAVRQLRKRGALLCIRRGSAVGCQKASDTQECPRRIVHSLSGIGSGVIRANPIFQRNELCTCSGPGNGHRGKAVCRNSWQIYGSASFPQSSRSGRCHSLVTIRKPLLINVLGRTREPFTGY